MAAEIIPGYFIHTPDEKFGPYANIMEADTAAEKLMSEGVQVIGITKEGFEGVVSYEALEYSAESFEASKHHGGSRKKKWMKDNYEHKQKKNLNDRFNKKTIAEEDLREFKKHGRAESFSAEEITDSRGVVWRTVAEYPHTMSDTQHEELMDALDEYEEKHEIKLYVRYGDTVRILTNHPGSIYGLASPPFPAESFAANPEGRPYCEPCAERGFNYYGVKTCGDCGYIQCERCFGDGEICKSCGDVECENCGDMESPDWIFTTPHGEFCVDCRSAWIEDPDAHKALYSAEDDALPEHIKKELRKKWGITQKDTRLIKRVRQPPLTQRGTPRKPLFYQDYDLTSVTPAGWTHREAESYSAETKSDGEEYEYFDDFSDLEGYTQGPWFSHPMIGMSISGIKGGEEYGDSVGHSDQDLRLLLSAPELFEELKACKGRFNAESSAAEGLFCPSCKDNTRMNEDEEWCHLCEASYEAESFAAPGLWDKLRGRKDEPKEDSKKPIKWGIHRLPQYDSQAKGTYLVGELPPLVDYKLLKEVFGQPDSGSGDRKVRKSWTLSIDGVICTIYDWKTGKWPLKDIDDWHIGGHSELSARLVRGAIAEHMTHRFRHAPYNAESFSAQEAFKPESNFIAIKKLKKNWKENHSDATWDEMLSVEIGRLRNRLIMKGYDPNAKIGSPYYAESFAAETSNMDFKGFSVVYEHDDEVIKSYHNLRDIVYDFNEGFILDTDTGYLRIEFRPVKKLGAESFSADITIKICDACQEQTDWTIIECKECGSENCVQCLEDSQVIDDCCLTHWSQHWRNDAESFSAESSVRKGMMGNTEYRWYVDGDESIQDRNGEPLIRPYDEEEIDEDIQHNIKLFLEGGEKKGEAYHEVHDLHDRFDEPQYYDIFYSWGAESFSAESWRDACPACGERSLMVIGRIQCENCNHVVHPDEWHISPMYRNAESKIPPAEKAGITGITSGATMEGLETLLASDDGTQLHTYLHDMGECQGCGEKTWLVQEDVACEDCEYCEYCDEYHHPDIRRRCYEEAFSKHYDGPAEDGEYDAEGDLEETQEELAEVRTELSKSRTGMSLIRTGLAIGGFILLWEHHKWAKQEHESKENTV